MKKLEVLAVIHYGNYGEDCAVVDDKCPCCKWDPRETPDGRPSANQGNELPHENEPDWQLGAIWAPGAERGCGAYFQVIHCQGCGLVYATHVN
jgi:hypothetical protein